MVTTTVQPSGGHETAADGEGGFLSLFLDCGPLEDKRGALVPGAGMERQDGPDDCVLTPREPGHHSPLHKSLLDQVMLTEGSPGSSQWPQLVKQNGSQESVLKCPHQSGASVRGDRVKEEFIPPDPAKAH